MRISDWSSDVCSSDLNLPLACAHRDIIVFELDPLANVGDRQPPAVLADHSHPGVLAGRRKAVNGHDREAVIEDGPRQAVMAHIVPVSGSDREIAKALRVDRDPLAVAESDGARHAAGDRKSTRLNSSH